MEADSDKPNFNEYMLTNGTAEFANSNKDEVYSSMLRSNEKSVDNHYCPVVIQTASFAKESDKEDRDKESITERDGHLKRERERIDCSHL